MKFVFYLLKYIGITYFIREMIQKKKVTILLYHDISIENAERHFSYLRSRYNIISLQDFIMAYKRIKVNELPPKSLIITLDDGHKGNYALLPLLKRLNIPITIFLCAEIVATKRNYWFKHQFSGKPISELKKLSNSDRLEYLKKHSFEQDKCYDERVSLSYEEIIEMSEVVDFQSHTLYHPCLPYCSDNEAEFEILGSKNKLESLFGFKINTLSYPNGDYSDRDIGLLKKGGYESGITCDLWFNDQKTDLYKLKRLDCRDNASIVELESKVTGVYIFLKRIIFGNSFGYIARN